MSICRNTGVIIDKIPKTDYIAGAETEIVYKEVNPSGDWLNSLPTEESQHNLSIDTMACVSFSALNCIETQCNFLLQAGKIGKRNIKKLTDWGYIKDGKFNFSDRFTAKVSGTTKNGNSGQKVWDSIRKDSEGKGFGLVPEDMWKFEDTFNWDFYYSEIPQEILDFGKNIWEVFDFKYEWVSIGNCGYPAIEQMELALKQAPLQIFTPCCTWGGEVIKPCGSCTPQHATMIYNIGEYINDFDHYEPYKKVLDPTFTIPFVLKGVVSVKKDITEQITDFKHVFTIDMEIKQTSEEIKWLQKGLKILGFFPEKIDATGYYGEYTRQAVRDFQFAYSVASGIELLFVNGKRVGVKTRRKLNELLIK